MNGILELLLVTLGLSVLMAVIYRVLQKPEQIKAIKQRQAEIKEQMDRAKKVSDKAAAEKAMAELLKVNQEQLKMNMKPMLLTTVIFFVALVWIGAAYANLTVSLPFTLPFLGAQLNWFWWYFVIIIPGVQIFRKAFGVE